LKRQFLGLKRKWKLASIIPAEHAKALEPNLAIALKLVEHAEERVKSFVRKDFSASSLPVQIAEVPDKLSPIHAPTVMEMGGFLKTKLSLSLFLQVLMMVPDSGYEVRENQVLKDFLQGIFM
tara:strand:+ start:201 stop:566 length:366 start_codon:yes stop_codon:yes gene_type:complete